MNALRDIWADEHARYVVAFFVAYWATMGFAVALMVGLRGR